jgi:hypothetical protein
MTEYTTETGFYVLCDSEGRVISKSNVPVGTHPVTDIVDATESYDVGSQDELDAVEIDSHYAP